ncbi:hypothetical protein SCLCIDRAFT_379134 [Scleroderma citrinum Foug A]|uniref:Uncharacterized protein n=1 Tax=Scleroderma citrinum Foug A TaxID=1036808 RepID=A0A0C3D0Q0_9AGAM|nr:hypothetical protein SCLCIDRAFT_379134 [Scleroderma citrinum Foug A]
MINGKRIHTLLTLGHSALSWLLGILFNSRNMEIGNRPSFPSDNLLVITTNLLTCSAKSPTLLGPVRIVRNIIRGHLTGEPPNPPLTVYTDASCLRNEQYNTICDAGVIRRESSLEQGNPSFGQRDTV